MRMLSKSKLMAYRQCPRRLWLEVHRPELRQDSEVAQASFDTGNEVGELARHLYAPSGLGTLIHRDEMTYDELFTWTRELLLLRQPIFEGTFGIPGAMVMTDVLLPAGSNQWKLIEVKSSTKVKAVHHDDLAVQTHVLTKAGLALASVCVAHIDNQWVYPGNAQYQGLLKEEDLTLEVSTRTAEVNAWITDGQRIVASKEPRISTGRHCDQPYECGFYAHCRGEEPADAEFPINWLPRFNCEAWWEDGVCDMRELPSEALNQRQQRVRDCTLNQTQFFDQEKTRHDLMGYPPPGYFMDFESIQFGVPRWAGSPYQQLCFQYSVHRMSPGGALSHHQFLDLSGMDPRRQFAEQLIADCGTSGPVFVYNASFEKGRIAELASVFSDISAALLGINDRVMDLLPLARNHYYHPSQQGSWSLKKVLPALVPELDYGNLDGVQDGGGAQEAYLEAICRDTTVQRREMSNSVQNFPD